MKLHNIRIKSKRLNSYCKIYVHIEKIWRYCTVCVRREVGGPADQYQALCDYRFRYGAYKSLRTPRIHPRKEGGNEGSQLPLIPLSCTVTFKTQTLSDCILFMYTCMSVHLFNNLLRHSLILSFNPSSNTKVFTVTSFVTFNFQSILRCTAMNHAVIFHSFIHSFIQSFKINVYLVTQIH